MDPQLSQDKTNVTIFDDKRKIVDDDDVVEHGHDLLMDKKSKRRKLDTEKDLISTASINGDPIITVNDCFDQRPDPSDIMDEEMKYQNQLLTIQVGNNGQQCKKDDEGIIGIVELEFEESSTATMVVVATDKNLPTTTASTTDFQTILKDEITDLRNQTEKEQTVIEEEEEEEEEQPTKIATAFAAATSKRKRDNNDDDVVEHDANLCSKKKRMIDEIPTAPHIIVPACIVKKTQLIFPPTTIEEERRRLETETIAVEQELDKAVRLAIEALEGQEAAVKLYAAEEEERKRIAATTGEGAIDAAAAAYYTKLAAEKREEVKYTDDKTSQSSLSSEDNSTVQHPIVDSANSNEEKMEQEQAKEEDTICCFCLEEPDTMDLADVNCSCHKRFCFDCIKEWGSKKGVISCPYCRQQVTYISCVHDKSKNFHCLPKPLDPNGEVWLVQDLVLPDYFEVGRDGEWEQREEEAIGIDAWIMTGDHVNWTENLPSPLPEDQGQEVLEGLLDPSKRQQWGLTEEQAQVFEVTLRGRRSVRMEFEHTSRCSEEISFDARLLATKIAAAGMIYAQEDGPAAIQVVLERYRSMRFYTRADSVHSFYECSNGYISDGKFIERKYGCTGMYYEYGV